MLKQSEEIEKVKESMSEMEIKQRQELEQEDINIKNFIRSKILKFIYGIYI